MRILVQFCVDADIIECPDFIVNDLKSYQNEFMIKQMTTLIGCMRMEKNMNVVIDQKHL